MTATNQDGEIFVKTPGQFTGYWNNSDATDDSVDGQGWFKTGRQTDRAISLFEVVGLYRRKVHLLCSVFVFFFVTRSKKACLD